MAADYDAPKVREGEEETGSLEGLQAAVGTTLTAVLGMDELDTAEGINLPGADLSREELSVQVVPQMADEFTCMSCFLVHHRSLVAREKDGFQYCTECEG